MSPVHRLSALLALAASPLVAQEAVPAAQVERTGRFGVGVTMNPTTVFIDDSFGFLPFGVQTFVVPIRTGMRTTLEPEVGIVRFSSSSSGFGSTNESSVNNLRLGVGLLMDLTERGGLRPYIGPRVGVNRTTTEFRSSFGGGTNENTTKQNGWYISGVFGAQHFFTRHFSLGGEVQLTRMSMKTTETSTGGGALPEGEQSLVSSTGIALIRWFF